ncbi:hypothetical protein IQ26_06096 [Mesorhizobium tianshanense]|uniref:Uncharacterized protein n=1 Tax=Mesorhizobium tianshanense TaxID=39844 RepID=A0A562MZQ6_9HYPH|nr:hypothetical protein IQ26_06096 [Mesorhizobium tianshanense]
MRGHHRRLLKDRHGEITYPISTDDLTVLIERDWVQSVRFRQILSLLHSSYSGYSLG